MANKKVSQLTSKPSVLTTDLFPIADPSTGQLFKTTISDLGTAIGSGVSSVNGLVGAVVLDTDDIQELVSPTNKWFTDTRARAALSASSPLTYNSGTGVFGIQVANGSQNGYLSSADWTTFNAKQAALSGTGFVKSTGGTISYDTNTYLTTSSAASTYLALAGGTMTGALFGASASFSGYVGFNGNSSPLYPVDVAGSGRFSGDLRIESTNPRIYLTDTDNNPDYFISNTDGTFTVYDVTNSASRLTISSSQIQPRLPIVSNSSIQGTAFYSDSFFSATTFVQATTFMASPSYRLTGGTSPTGLYFGHTDKVVLANYTVGGGIDFETNGGNITMQLSSGGVLSTTGGASFSGALSGTSASFSSILTSVGATINGANNAIIDLYNTALADSNARNWRIVTNESSWGTLEFRVSTANNNAPSSAKLILAKDGAATFSSSVTAGSISSGANINAYVSSYGNNGLFQSFGTDGNLKLQMGALGTNEAFIYTGASNKLSIYTGGSTSMTITSSGNVGIGTTSPGYKLSVEGAAGELVSIGSSTQKLYFYPDSVGVMLSTSTGQGGEGIYFGNTSDFMFFQTNNTERMRITSSGNVFIGKTTGSSKFGVSGLPTSSAGLSSGDFYQVAGAVMVVP